MLVYILTSIYSDLYKIKLTQLTSKQLSKRHTVMVWIESFWLEVPVSFIIYLHILELKITISEDNIC